MKKEITPANTQAIINDIPEGLLVGITIFMAGLRITYRMD